MDGKNTWRWVMTTARKYIAWGAGILTWIFASNILLAYWAFGYIDWATVSDMAFILVPLLLIGAVCFYHVKPAKRLEVHRGVYLNRTAENTR